MKDLNEALKNVDAGSKDMGEIVDFVYERFVKAHKKNPAEAAALVESIIYMTGMLIPTFVEERSYGPVQMKLIEAMGHGIQAGMEAVGSKASMEMVVRRL